MSGLPQRSTSNRDEKHRTYETVSGPVGSQTRCSEHSITDRAFFESNQSEVSPEGQTLPTPGTAPIISPPPKATAASENRPSTRSGVFTASGRNEADSHGFSGFGVETEAEIESGPGTDAEMLAREDAPGRVKKAEKAARQVVVDDFDLMRVLGKGRAGKVLLVRHRASNELYALKAITKRHVIARQELQHTLTEQAVLKRMARESKHPFVVKLWWSFHDRENLFLVMDFHPGGDLATQLARRGRLGWNRARFYAAEIVEGCEGLHAASVIYRDLKPENILIGADGHIVLTDFGLSKEFPRKHKGHPPVTPSAPPTPGHVTPHWMGAVVWPERASTSVRLGRDMTSTFCGTAKYLAPEVIQGLPYSYEVDWWSFGTMLYEMLTGSTPFGANSDSDMYRRVLQDEVRFPNDESMDPDTESLIRGLLQRNPAQRLCEPRVKKHPYFSSVDWQRVYYKGYIPPYIPPIDPANAGDTQNFSKAFLDMEPVIVDEIDPTDLECEGPDLKSARTALGGKSPERSNATKEELVDVFDGYSFKTRESIIINDEESSDGEHEEHEEVERFKDPGLGVDAGPITADESLHATSTELPELEPITPKTPSAAKPASTSTSSLPTSPPSRTEKRREMTCMSALDRALDGDSDGDCGTAGEPGREGDALNRRTSTGAKLANNLSTRGVVDRYRLSVFNESPHLGLSQSAQVSRQRATDAVMSPGANTVSSPASPVNERHGRMPGSSLWSAEQFLRAEPPSATDGSSTLLQEISGTMSSEEILQCLVNYGCVDLAGRMDLDQCSQESISVDGFGDIWRGKLYGGIEVAIKVLRFRSIPHNGLKPMKRAMREIYNWSKVKHSNIQELMGVIMFQGRLGMVSLWRGRGNLREYISNHPTVDRYPLCVQVATGVSYLHGCEMAHGDLKAICVNVIVDNEGVAKLRDVTHATISECTPAFSDSHNLGGGTLRWMAPELLLSSEEKGSPSARRSKQADVYALGMTLLEVITGQVPYAECKREHSVYRALDKKRPPARPSALLGQVGRDDQLWSLLMRCWNFDPPARPLSHQILEELESLATGRSSSSSRALLASLASPSMTGRVVDAVDNAGLPSTPPSVPAMPPLNSKSIALSGNSPALSESSDLFIVETPCVSGLQSVGDLMGTTAEAGVSDTEILAPPSMQQAVATLPLSPSTPEPSTPPQMHAALLDVDPVTLTATDGQTLLPPVAPLTSPTHCTNCTNATPTPAGSHLSAEGESVTKGSSSEAYHNRFEGAGIETKSKSEFDAGTDLGKLVEEDGLKAINLNNMAAPEASVEDSKMAVQSALMSSDEMFQCLVSHGCVDLTVHMDPDQYSQGLILGGGFGDIWKGKLYDGTEVAIKVWRFCSIPHNGLKPMKRAMREIYNWSKAKHSNIQELMGVIMFQGRLGMVSLWMGHGNLREYISNHPTVDRYPLCVQVATGVSYLHGCGMVHGDLKATNILVDRDGVAKLSDFDHSILSECTLIFSSTTNPGGGTLRWMAPELLLSSEEEGCPPGRRNKQTDVYALGMTLLEIITGRVPYSEYKHDHGVYRALDKKRPPTRPEVLSGPAKQRELMWTLLVRCWDHDPEARPSSHQILEELESLVNTGEEQSV